MAILNKALMWMAVSVWWSLRGLYKRGGRGWAAALLCFFSMMLLPGCESFDVELPTATEPRVFSAPTLIPSPTVPLLLPTDPPEDAHQPGQSLPEIADLPAQAEVPPFVVDVPNLPGAGQSVSVTLREGVTVNGLLYENPPLELEAGIVITPRLPGLLLLSPVEGWGGFPAQLRDAGYTVLVMTFEGGAANDIVAILRAFSQTPSVNPGLMAVIGAGQGAALALAGCAIEILCDAVVLLSPVDAQTLLNVIGAYNPRPLLVVVGAADAESYEAAQGLQGFATGPYTLQPYPGAERGGDLLLAQPDLPALIAAWLQTHLQDDLP